MNTFLILIKIDDKHYLSLTENNSIAAYETKEAVMEAFSGFKRFLKGDATSQCSAALALCQTRPYAILFNKPATDLADFIIADKSVHFKGGAISFGKTPFIEVKSEIEDYKVFDLFKELLEESDAEKLQTAIEEAEELIAKHKKKL